MKKVFMLLATGVAVLGLMACSANSENNTESTPATEEKVEAEAEAQEPAADPQQRDFESADLSLTIPEGWKGSVGVFDEVKMEGNPHKTFIELINQCLKSNAELM